MIAPKILAETGYTVPMTSATVPTEVVGLRQARTVARAALQQFHLDNATLTVLARSHNYVYRVAMPDGERFILRVQRSNELSDQVVTSQLLWLEVLSREADLVVPEPVRLPDGTLCNTTITMPGMQPRRCLLLRWVEGRRRAGRAITPANTRAMGATIARMHLQAERFAAPPGFSCPRLDAEFLFGDQSFVHSDRDRSVLSHSDYEVLRRAGTHIRAVMDSLGENPKQFGLIHADLIPENFVFHKGTARPIDFDEFGYGYYLFDLVVALTFFEGWKHYLTLWEPLLAAYQRLRPLPEATSANLNLFRAAGHVAYLNFGFMRMPDHAYQDFLGWVSYKINEIATLIDPVPSSAR